MNSRVTFITFNQTQNKIMIKNLTLGLLAGLFCYEATAQESLSFLPQPDSNPKLFAPGKVSLDQRFEFGCTLSKDGKDFYFGEDPNYDTQAMGVHRIWKMSFEDGEWGDPQITLSDPQFTSNDPMLSPDQSRLYFISNRPLQGSEEKDIDIWYVEKRDQGWSKPFNVGAPINSSVNEYFISFSTDGSMYFSSNVNATENSRNFDIYRSQWNGSTFETPVALPETINTEYYEADVFVSPDENYLVFASARRGGNGQGDLYISFNSEGQWSQAKNMGDPINDPGHQFCPFVSPDGKFFFYTSNKDIYWVSTAIFDNYR